MKLGAFLDGVQSNQLDVKQLSFPKLEGAQEMPNRKVVTEAELVPKVFKFPLSMPNETPSQHTMQRLQRLK